MQLSDMQAVVAIFLASILAIFTLQKVWNFQPFSPALWKKLSYRAFCYLFFWIIKRNIWRAYIFQIWSKVAVYLDYRRCDFYIIIFLKSVVTWKQKNPKIFLPMQPLKTLILFEVPWPLRKQPTNFLNVIGAVRLFKTWKSFVFENKICYWIIFPSTPVRVVAL